MAMNLSEVVYGAGVPIDGYGPGHWTVGGHRWEGGVLVLPSGPSAWTPNDPTPVLAARQTIDLVILGTGAEIAHAPPAFRDPLEEAGIGVEVMASPQAARTYNVLLGEGRRVAVALTSLD